MTGASLNPVRPDLELAARLYARMGEAVERLLAMMDVLEGDADLEPYLAGSDPRDGDREGTGLTEDGDEDDEPSLGAPERHPLQMDVPPRLARRRSDQTHWADGGAPGPFAWAGEMEHDTADDEPTLGSLDGCGNQAQWSAGGGPLDELEPYLAGYSEGMDDTEGGDVQDERHDPEPDDEDGGDDEPSLGSGHPDPWIVGALNPEVNATPGLNGVDQTFWANGSGDDREYDAGDEPEVENEHGGDLGS